MVGSALPRSNTGVYLMVWLLTLGCIFGLIFSLDESFSYLGRSLPMGQPLENEALQKHNVAFLEGRMTAPSLLLSDAWKFARCWASCNAVKFVKNNREEEL